jgi:hypothetical protein
MKPLKIFGAVAVVMSVILGGVLYWLFTNDSKAASELYFQILCASAGVLLLSGFGLLLMSRKKPDAFEETISVLTKKEILDIADGAGAKDIKSQPRGNAPIEGSVIPAVQSVNPVLSFEEEMALRKKQFYHELVNVPAKEEPEKIHLPQKSISLTPPASAKIETEKVKIKLEFPFGKKKIETDPLKQLLADEERNGDKVTTWKSH